MIDLLTKLADMCSHTVHVTVNQHKNYMMSVEEYIRDTLTSFATDEPETFDKMVELNRIVEVQAFPISSGLSFMTYHWDVQQALEQAIESMKEFQ